MRSRKSSPEWLLFMVMFGSYHNPIHFLAIWAYQVATVGGRKSERAFERREIGLFQRKLKGYFKEHS